jgi:hypothetical protein
MVSCRDVLWLVSFFILWSPVGCPSQFKVAFEQEWFLQAFSLLLLLSQPTTINIMTMVTFEAQKVTSTYFVDKRKKKGHFSYKK